MLTSPIPINVTVEQRVGSIMLDADRAKDKWKEVLFDPPFSTNKEEVIVIPMTQTYNGDQTPGLRVIGVNHKGFKVRFDEVVFYKDSEQIGADGAHNPERVGWVAFAFTP